MYVIRNNLKRPDAVDVALLPQTEQEYCNLTLGNRNRCYIEDSKKLYLLLEDLMLGTDGCEWLGEVAMRNSNGNKSFGDLQTHYGGPGEHLKRVAKSNKILEIFTTRIKIQQLLLNFMPQVSKSRTRYSRIMARFTMIHRKCRN